MSRTLSPAQLHRTLDVAPSIDMTFPNEFWLESYRQKLYRENAKGDYAYRTRRYGLTLTITRQR